MDCSGDEGKTMLHPISFEKLVQLEPADALVVLADKPHGFMSSVRKAYKRKEHRRANRLLKSLVVYTTSLHTDAVPRSEQAAFHAGRYRLFRLLHLLDAPDTDAVFDDIQRDRSFGFSPSQTYYRLASRFTRAVSLYTRGDYNA